MISFEVGRGAVTTISGKIISFGLFAVTTIFSNVIADESVAVRFGVFILEVALFLFPFLAYSGFLNELFLTRVGQMILAGKDTKEITQELKRLDKRYVEDTLEVIPDAWKGSWLKEYLKKKRTGASTPTKRTPASVVKKENND